MTTSDDVSFVMPQPAGVIGSLDLNRVNRLARALVQRVPGGTTFGLLGTLGAGKTTLVRAIAGACGVDVADVTSPTFTLLQTYHGCLTIHHLDAYRLADEDEFLELGVEELFEDQGAWTLVEWADRVAGVMPSTTLWLHIDFEAGQAVNREPSGEPLRCVSLASHDPLLMRTIETIVAEDMTAYRSEAADNQPVSGDEA
jgi:tRNA threonylcarbamoyladenosine biosynthesis protein TsaE